MNVQTPPMATVENIDEASSGLRARVEELKIAQQAAAEQAHAAERDYDAAVQQCYLAHDDEVGAELVERAERTLEHAQREGRRIARALQAAATQLVEFETAREEAQRRQYEESAREKWPSFLAAATRIDTKLADISADLQVLIKDGRDILNDLKRAGLHSASDLLRTNRIADVLRSIFAPIAHPEIEFPWSNRQEILTFARLAQQIGRPLTANKSEDAA